MSDAGAAAPVAPPQGALVIAVTLCLCVTGTMIFKVLPLVVGAAANSYQLTAAQLGALASSDLAGIALASVLAPLWVRRVDWRLAARLALALVVLGNLLSIVHMQLAPLLAVRFVTGLGEGTATGLALTILGSTRNPDRNFGLAMAAPILLGMLGFRFLPAVVEQWGFGGVMAVFAAIAFIILLTQQWLPRRAPVVQHTGPGDGTAGSLVFVALLATGLNHLAIGAVWAFVERLGSAAGLAPDTVGSALASAVMVGFFGALAATVLAGRWGRGLPLVASVAGQLLALLLLADPADPFTYTLAVCLFQFCWLYAGAYQLATISLADTSGRFFVLTIAFQAGGITLGPGLAGWLIGAAGFSAMLLLAAAAFGGSIVLYLGVLAAADRPARAAIVVV